MQDNFNQFSEWIYDPWCDNPKDYYYNVAIIKRTKDGHETGRNSSRTIKQYFISTPEDLEKNKNEIMTICEIFHARAYIDPQCRNYKDLALELNVELAERLRNNAFEKIHRVLFSAATQCKRENRLWILDVDNSDDLQPVLDYLKQPIVFTANETVKTEKYTLLEEGKTYTEENDYTKLVVKTNSGYHVITKPFDLREFIVKFPNVEIKKNNMTCLYVPKSLENHG